MTAKLPPPPTPPRVTLTRDHEDAGMEFAYPESPVQYEYLSIEEHNQLLEEKVRQARAEGRRQAFSTCWVLTGNREILKMLEEAEAEASAPGRGIDGQI